MKRADLHVHSRYSAHPSEWFLQRLGTRESYTEPEKIYEDAKARGMDFVTISDHNCVCGAFSIKEKYPNDVIVGCEFTTYFPENGCKIHVLVWGLTREQFHEIGEIRQSIYDLRDYLKRHDLAHAVAHATFSINRKLDADFVEKLILLFDYFEGVNGSREFRSNQFLQELLRSLTPSKIDELERKHKIIPYSDRSWIKGITGGSDDHSGLFIGHSFTCIDEDVKTQEEFLQALKRKKSYAGGRHNDYRGFALALYKIAFEFTQSRSNALSNTLFSTLSEMLFTGQKLGLKKKLALKSYQKKQEKLGEALGDLINDLQENSRDDIDTQIDRIYSHAVIFSDLFFDQFMNRISESFSDGDLAGVIRNLSGMIPAVFISMPFFTTISILNQSRHITEELRERHFPMVSPRHKRVLWFTDTLTDLNGVSETLQKISEIADRESLNLRIVTAEDEEIRNIPKEMVIQIAKVSEYPISFFEGFTLKVPSLLNALQQISAYGPDELVISTPGPVGVIGLVAAKLLNIKVSGIYHTDFANYFRTVTNDENVSLLVQDAMKMFYNAMDRIFVPSEAYKRILMDRGYEIEKLRIFRRGIDPWLFTPDKRQQNFFEQEFNLTDGVNLLYTGRISEEKNIRYLLDVYDTVAQKHPDTNLVLCGEGTLFNEMKERYKENSRVVFAGRVSRETLSHFYSSADLLLFPSVTDTFGMTVLEAQASGLPAVVSKRGGPQEIIEHSVTGYAVSTESKDEWVKAISTLVEMIDLYPEQYHELRHRTRANTVARFRWSHTIEDVLGIELFDEAESENSIQRSPLEKSLSLSE